MKYIKSASFSPVMHHTANGWQNRIMVVFEMVALWVREEEQIEEISWFEFNSNIEELEFIISKLQSVVDKSKAAYTAPTKEALK